MVAVVRHVGGTLGDRRIATGGQGRWRDAVGGYFRALWAGTEPLHRVVISDVLIGGTLINLVTLVLSLVVFGIEAPRWLGLAVFLSPLPYNAFLVLAVWRTAAHSQSLLAWPARVGVLVWLGFMFLI